MVNTLMLSNILLWIVVLILFVVVFALTRQIGVLYERVAPAGALMLNQKLQAGMVAPELDVLDINGNKVSLGQSETTSQSTLLFFISPTCPICKTLLPVIKSASKDEKSWLRIILASDGSEHNHQAYIKEHDLEQFPYVLSEVLGMTYGVSKLPYAVLIDETGKITSMGIINSREHLESLFESKELGVASIQDYMSGMHDSGKTS